MGELGVCTGQRIAGPRDSGKSFVPASSDHAARPTRLDHISSVRTYAFGATGVHCYRGCNFESFDRDQGRRADGPVIRRCISTPAGPNAADNRGGQSAAKGAVRYNAKAHCTRTGKPGYVYRQSTAADTAAKAIGMCIRNGGIPACCRVDSITPVRV